MPHFTIRSLRHSFFLLFLLPLGLMAQDAYHTGLQSSLQASYNLPAGSWVLNNTEAANLQNDYTYGGVTATNSSASGQDFSQKVQLEVMFSSGPQWTSGYGIGNVNPVSTGDHCLAVFWAKANGEGKASLSIQDNTTFATELYYNIPLDEDWLQYLVPFQASQNYGVNDLGMLLQVNWLDQEIEVGGMAILNYGSSVSLEDLPRKLNNEFYGGYEADAPWRAEAAQRIEQIRKADLSVQVLGADLTPLENVSVEFNMVEHDFEFGTAVAVQNIAGNSLQNDTYEDRLLDLDGEGHRFNSVVFENAVKWDAWEEGWFGVTQADKVATLAWLQDRGFPVRGHTLIWPSFGNMPDDIVANQNDPNYILDRVVEHVETILTYPGLEGGFKDWDVINEISILQDLADAMQGAPGYPTGREIYLDILDKFYEADPNGVAYLNDYTVFGAGSSPQLYADFKTYLQEIVDAGSNFDGIGFQGHIGVYPTGIPEYYDILEDFSNTFGKRSKITEYDIKPEVDDDLAAQYLRDFYTMTFSHPSMDGILMWGYWDGNHWFNNAPMFDEDWTLKPAGEAFLDLVFEEWWTEVDGSTDVNGLYATRGFKGTYEVVVGCPDGTYTQTIDVLTDTSLPIDCSTVSTNEAFSPQEVISIAPNPTDGWIKVSWEKYDEVDLMVFDMLGRLQYSQTGVSSPLNLELDLSAGTYQLLLKTKETVLTQRVIVE